MSKTLSTETGTTRGGPHHAPRLRRDQCLLFRQIGHRASECPNKGSSSSDTNEETCVWHVCSGFRVGCDASAGKVHSVVVLTINFNECEEERDPSDIEVVVGGATKIVSGCWTDQYEEATIEMMDASGLLVVRPKLPAPRSGFFMLNFFREFE